MTDQEHRPGSIPARYRRLVIWVPIVTVVFLFAFGLLARFVLGIPIDWIWLIVTPLFVTALIMLFLWVRLSD